MKYLLLLLIPVLLFSETLVSKDGRTVEAEILSFDGTNLKIEANGRIIKFDPNLLDEKCWEKINYNQTKSMGVSVRLNHQSSRKKDDLITRDFHVEVSSTSHFHKEIKINYYWLGRGVYAESKNVSVDFSNRHSERLVAKIKIVKGTFGPSYHLTTPMGKRGSCDKGKVDLLVVVEDMDGKIVGYKYYNGVGEKAFKNLKK